MKAAADGIARPRDRHAVPRPGRMAVSHHTAAGGAGGAARATAGGGVVQHGVAGFLEVADLEGLRFQREQFLRQGDQRLVLHHLFHYRRSLLYRWFWPTWNRFRRTLPDVAMPSAACRSPD